MDFEALQRAMAAGVQEALQAVLRAQAVSTPVDQQHGPRGHKILSAKDFSKLEKFEGQDERFGEWAFVFRTIVGSLSPKMQRVLEAVETGDVTKKTGEWLVE